MIITRKEFGIDNHQYIILVHNIDGDELATMYKDGQFHSNSFWNETEQLLASEAIESAKDINPIKTIWID